LLPEFFVRSGTIFSLAMLVAFTLQAMPTRKFAKGDNTRAGFVESEVYKAQKSKESHGVAMVGQPVAAGLPQ